ncbi:hypothetical protein RvY_09531 [Ramazzottius varieornatus]|uniref:Uncharacterized protein n=1 Tax=Ramazzottius varieornatus TaxID=947166 RepID=A0A1D1V9P4_RAMVA|nr:hypothetical protein RvY_09531 [Ramazzottius varieornatus]
MCTGIERETVKYTSQWEQQKVLWHWQAYELEIVACEELDEKFANEKETEEGKRLDVSMEKAVEGLADDVATLETELQRSTEVLDIQQKFASVTEQTDIVDDPTTISDMERWISILTNTDENIALEHFQPGLQQLFVRPNDEDDAMEKEQVDEVLRQMYDGRFPKSDFCFDDFLPLFVESSAVSAPQPNSGISEVLNSSKGEDRKQGVVAILDDERNLQNETKKIKWILVSKTKNLERIKDELSDITETNKRLQQACNEHHNALRNALNEENEVHEIHTKKLKEILMITAREESVLEAVNEERQEITSVLSQVLSTGQREVIALSDSTAVKVEQEEGLISSLAVTFAELHLMQATIERSKAEWKQQRVLRKQVAENIAEVSERLDRFRDTYQKVSESLNHQKASSEKILTALTQRRDHILRLQAEAESALVQALSSLETCRSNLEEIRRMNAEIVRTMSTATAAARNFSTRLHIDLEDLDKSMFAYKGFTRIVESYMPYIDVQSQYAMRTSEALLRKIKSVREDGHHAEEMKRKTLFGEDISGQLERPKSAGIEHHKRADFLRDLQTRLVELKDFSTIATELSTLSKLQGEKFSHIATKFLPAFLALR